jgi:NAD(P)-dependent dehydrogenase (short-subunit alcohol dehydrogenase family)
MRLQNKVAIVAGAGQTPGDTIGNGRATAILFAREGARVVLVDRDPESARETQAMIQAEGGACFVCEADITRAADCRAFTQAAIDAFGRIDVLHNNVGVGVGDKEAIQLGEEAWDRILDVNLKGMFLSCRQVLPVMREQQQGWARRGMSLTRRSSSRRTRRNSSPVWCCRWMADKARESDSMAMIEIDFKGAFMTL